MAEAIWKDKVITLDSSIAAFNVRLNNASGTIIYSGRCESIGGVRKVRINDICADYIANNLPRYGETYGTNRFVMTFCVEQGGTSKGTATFYWNWSYDNGFSDSAMRCLNFPIRKEVPTSFILPMCMSQAGTINWKRGTQAKSDTLMSPNAFHQYGSLWGKVVDALATAPVYFFADEVGSNMSLSVQESGTYREVYVGKQKCVDYVLMYLNAYGGWDVLAIDGFTKVGADFKRTTSNRVYDNTNLASAGTIVPVNEITHKATFNTGWIDDLGARRMHHLLGSTKAFVVDTQTYDITPILMTDASWEIKRHRSDGMINYAITAEVAQTFIRR